MTQIVQESGKRPIAKIMAGSRTGAKVAPAGAMAALPILPSGSNLDSICKNTADFEDDLKCIRDTHPFQRSGHCGKWKTGVRGRAATAPNRQLPTAMGNKWRRNIQPDRSVCPKQVAKFEAARHCSFHPRRTGHSHAGLSDNPPNLGPKIIIFSLAGRTLGLCQASPSPRFLGVWESRIG
jgi:hypothetical protein